MVPMLIITPLTFLGGTFCAIDMLPPFWQGVALLNQVVYLISGFRWASYENDTADIRLAWSLGMTDLFLLSALAVVAWMLKTGYRLKA